MIHTFISNMQGYSSSNQFVDTGIGRFTIHGSVGLSVQGRVLLVEGSGPWNLEAVKQANNHFSSLIETLYGEPWGVLVILHGDPIYVPDAANYLVKSIKRECKAGRHATAIMVEGSNSPEFAKRHLKELYQRANSEYRFFSDKSKAVLWLTQKIASAQGGL